MVESLFHAGDLDFKEPELSTLLELARTVPLVLVLHLERPAVIPELVEACAAVVAVFGAADEAVLDVSFRPDETRGQAPVRAAVVDGRRAGAASGCAGRLARPAVPPRTRARPLGR
jgi:hypothetical protein